ncbi:MAG: 2-amino-4-hydroxy-6-hydroxymethyldihydropteridine diphosphokinase [Planctomycetia bacterium]|nr:2-amino-4-hydroxy-6-hydroxymethyldihydropteridine diphosphokinase [Planctomycetia bacterium]
MTSKNVKTCLIGLGSNLGDRFQYLSTAWRQLGESTDIQTIRLASFIETEPIGGPKEQPFFLNSVGLIQTALSPYLLLNSLQKIEQKLQRVRIVHWGPRTVDLDLLFYDDLCCDEDSKLILPHPRLLWRPFVLEPAAEIAPNWRHPMTHLTLLDHWRLFQLNYALSSIVFSNQLSFQTK